MKDSLASRFVESHTTKIEFSTLALNIHFTSLSFLWETLLFRKHNPWKSKDEKKARESSVIFHILLHSERYEISMNTKSACKYTSQSSLFYLESTRMVCKHKSEWVFDIVLFITALTLENVLCFVTGVTAIDSFMLNEDEKVFLEVLAGDWLVLDQQTLTERLKSWIFYERNTEVMSTQHKFKLWRLKKLLKSKTELNICFGISFYYISNLWQGESLFVDANITFTWD